MSLKVEYRKISEIIEYGNNPRKNDHAVERTVAAIQEFGFRVPLVIKSNGELIDGHLRLKAAKQIGMTELPCLCADDMTEAQIKAFRLSVNKISDLADWDEELLKIEMQELDQMGFDLEAIGFSDEELENLLSEDEEEEYEEGADGEVSEPPEDPTTKEGDIWILGRHRVMCGDSTSIDAVDKLMMGNKADLVFTDPPYGVSFQSGMANGGTSNRFDVLKNDDVILDIAPLIYDVMNENTAAFIWTSHHVYTQWREQFNSFYKQTVIWYKRGGGIGDLEGSYALDYEMALFCVKGRPKFNGKRGMAVWDISKDSPNSYVHPTQKPTALSEKGIEEFCCKNGRVLDLFGGSGSTLIGCEKTNRKAYLMELDPKYCDVIVKRWQTLTGKSAILESTGEKFNEVS